MSTTLRRFACPEGILPDPIRGELEAALKGGAVVALPTETVYGLAVRADRREAIDRLRVLKGRPENLPLTWHIGDRRALVDVQLSSTVARIAKAFWPGPLTLVLRPAADELPLITSAGWLGVRLPAHAGTREFLASLPFPVVMTSANRSGGPALRSPDEIAAAFGTELGALIDAGPSHTSESSTVLRVGPGHFDLLREGLIGLPELRRSAGLRIAFACTGNTCRSPMAAGLAQLRLASALEVEFDSVGDFGFEVGSMGIYAAQGSSAADHGIAVMASHGIDIGQHRARTASEELVSQLDRIYGLTQSHVDALKSMLPAEHRKRVELLDPGGRGVPDPVGGSLADYQNCARVIDASIDKRVREWC